MINLKFTGIFAVFGFLLSFALGLFGGIGFGRVLLRAVLSALVSGGAAALVSFVFRNFLSENTASESAPKQAAGGNIVDIRLDEEPLPDTENSPDFYIPQTYSSAADKFPYARHVVQKQTAPDSSGPAVTAAKTGEVLSAKEQPVLRTGSSDSSPEPKVQAFVPKPLVAANAVTPAKEDEVRRNTNVSENRVENEQLDSLSELPDIEEMISDSVSSESGVIEDSVFAAEGISSGSPVPDVNPGNDTALIADAIRTLLKREG